MGRKRETGELKPGIPGSRTGDGLNVGLEPREDAFHPQKGFHYEWWYFQASFTEGYSAVAILWPMNYSRPWTRQCTIQLSIYTPEGLHSKHYVFPPRGLFSASRDRCDVRIEGSYTRDTGGGYEVHVEVEGDSIDLVFEPTVPGWKPGTAVNILPFPRFNTMGWLVPVPAARVHGRVTVGGRTVELRNGHGYHDHNWGEAPITNVVDNWHWGHVVSGDLAIVWSDITLQKAWDYDKIYMFLLSRGERLVMESPEIEVSYSRWTRDPAHLHPYPRHIDVSFGGAGTPARGAFSMDVETVIETQILLEMTGLPKPLIGLVHSTRFARPFYFRWLSRLEGWVETEGERLPLSGTTIHEQMLFRGRSPSECMKLAGR